MYNYLLIITCISKNFPKFNQNSIKIFTTKLAHCIRITILIHYLLVIIYEYRAEILFFKEKNYWKNFKISKNSKLLLEGERSIYYYSIIK
jgi:hypothetical protein